MIVVMNFRYTSLMYDYRLDDLGIAIVGRIAVGIKHNVHTVALPFCY